MRIGKRRSRQNYLNRIAAGGALLLLLAGASPAPGLPVFPGAVGFGTDTPAGRGGVIYRVMTLADSGRGSLREGVEKLAGPRTIIFDVGGVIRLRSDLKIPATGGRLTIAGQTAPEPGITLANGGIAVLGSDVLIQNIAIRPGDRLLPVENRDAIKLEPAPDQPVHHVVIDRVSASWAIDETFSTWGNRADVHDVTLSRSILSEPIVNGGHPKGSHPYAALGGRRTANLTLRENIFAFALGRNPLIRDENGGAQVVNNFIYRPGVWSNGVIYIGDLTRPPHAVSVVGNVVIRHPLPLVLEQTNAQGERRPVSYQLSDYRNTGIFVHKATVPEAALFLADNRFFDPHTGLWHPGDGNPWNPEIFHDNETHPVAHLTADPYAGSGGTPWRPLPSLWVENWVLGGTGKTPATRDALDAGLAEKIRTRTGSFRTDLVLPGAGDDPWQAVDSSVTRRLALPVEPDGDSNGDGYTNLEEWLHQLDCGVDDGGHAWLATPLAHETFADDAWRQRWTIEGHADVSVAENELHVATKPAVDDTNPGATLWWHEELPADVLIEFMAGAELPAEDNAANLNLILQARESDGSPYRPGRSGKYDEYHSLPNYILTLTGGFQEGWARVRRNPGFGLLAENRAIRSELGKNYHVRVALTGGRIRCWINGRLIHDVRDASPLPGGRLALRTWRSRVWWSDVRIYALRPAPEER
jgi:hypothetical protein